MSPSRPVNPGIRIDLDTETLWRGTEAVPLRPKTWAVLRYLVERPQSLAAKQDLLDSVWPGVVISEGTLNKSIGELRLALGDDRERPQFIETVSRRGFRWIADAVTVAGTATAGDHESPGRRPFDPQSAKSSCGNAESLVGREDELATLERCFARAASGTRQVVFVTGEAGAGKSRLIEVFLSRLHTQQPEVLTAQGQCIEAYGQHEPYRPLLEAAEKLASREDHGAAVLAALRSNAPTWLRQMPSLAGPGAASNEDAGMAPARMLREIAATMEEIPRIQPLVLVLEDAHWSDLATIDACNLIARRRDPARLLLIVSMRVADSLLTRHPVLQTKADLVARGDAIDLPASPFNATAVRDYLRQRCAGLPVDDDFADWIHHQTAGNPLFVRILVDDLAQRGILSQSENGQWRLEQPVSVLHESVPDSLRELVEGQAERLSAAERAVVEAACVLRSEFTPSTVAAVSAMAEEEVEEICSHLVRRGQFLRSAGRQTSSRADGYAFVHSMVQRILHNRLPASRKRRLHLAAAAELEKPNSGRGDGSTLQLALHCAMAGDPARALAQLQRAADSVQRIPAPREVIVIREQILDLVRESPDLPGHRRELIVALMDLAQARQLAFAVVDAETTALCEKVVELATTAEDGRE